MILDVQHAALSASAGQSGFGFFMEQGLGKTLTDYLDFMRAVGEGRVHRKVSVVPNSFKGGWIDEAEKWNINVENFIFESGNDWANEKFIKKSFNRPPHLIINYEAIRSDNTQNYIRRFIGNRPSWITFDESIKLKTHNSSQTVAGITLAQNFDYQRILSGKPITQGPHDLWGQMRAIRKLNGRVYYPFKTAFCKMGGFKMKQVIGAQNEDILAELIEPHVFRATKADWTDLPPKLYTHREYQMTPAMRAMYRQMEEEFVLWLDSGENVSVDAAITKYIKLAQIQCGFIIREDGKVEELVDPAKNPRIMLIKEIIDDEVTGKVIIPYKHRYSLEILMKSFGHLRPSFIKGQMTDAEVRENKRLFNEDPNCRAIFLQIEAAKYGHTLLGGVEPQNRCSTMVFFENTYSLDSRSQIEDRMHRHGQTADSVLYIDPWGTKLDREATRALQRKEGIFQSVFRNIRSFR